MAFCMYLRKSRADMEAEAHGEGETLARHRATLEQLSRKLKKPIAEVYQEIVSGESIADRPQMQRLLADVSAKKWEGVYVMEVERLARGDTMDQGLVFHAFRYSDTLIITPMRTYNPCDPADEEYFEFSLFMSRREYKTTARRMQAGKIAAAREGKSFNGRAAYGYRTVKCADGRGVTFEQVEDEAPVLYQIRDWLLNGVDGEPCGLTRIARMLNDAHVPTRQHAAWTSAYLHHLVTNPVYAGYIRMGARKTERVATPSGVQKRLVRQDDPQLFCGQHPPYFSDAEFDAMRAKLRTRCFPIRGDAEMINPFCGLLFCGECGRAMMVNRDTARNRTRIRCNTSGCCTVQSVLPPVEAALLETLRQWVDDPGSFVIPDAPPEENPILLQSTADSLRAERGKVAQQIERAQDLLEQGVYSVEQYSERFAKHSARLREIDASLADLQHRIDARPQYCTLDEISPAIRALLDDYDAMSALQRNGLLKQCISRIVYHKSKSATTSSGSAPASFVLDVFPRLK